MLFHPEIIQRNILYEKSNKYFFLSFNFLKINILKKLNKFNFLIALDVPIFKIFFIFVFYILLFN